MRLTVLSLLMLCFISASAQTRFDGRNMNYRLPSGYLNDSLHLHKKWSLTTFGGIAAQYSFLYGPNATLLSAPAGLQLNRQLNKNWYAFAAVSAAPAYFSFNGPFTNSMLNKSYPNINFSNANKFGWSAGLEGGLMYVNDEKTFSISGSIRVDRGSYPVYPGVYHSPASANRF